MLDQIKNTIIRCGLFGKGDAVLVAVSGGADSVSLLYALSKLAPEFGIKIIVVHMNHCIRGKASNEDALFVEQLARSLKVPFETGKSDVPRRAKRKGISLEMAAREARYAFFSRTARKTGAVAVATAHTADDQAETVLLKLARGAGPAGLGGMAVEKSLDGLKVVRPMLNVYRKQVMRFLHDNGLTWCEDETNTDLSYLRNNVRHKVIPFIESELNPGFRSALLRTAEVMRDENSWLEELSSEMLDKYTNSDGSLSCDGVAENSPAAVRRILRMWLTKNGVVPEQLGFDAVARVMGVIASRSGRTEVAGGWGVAKRSGDLCISKGNSAKVVRSFRQALNNPGETLLLDPGYLVTVEKVRGFTKKRPAGAGVLPAGGSISASAVGQKKLYVRSWRAGDRMRPFGLGGSKKLQDIFVDEKTPLEQRGAVPVVECGGVIVWIPGYRVAEGWQVCGSDDLALKIRVERIS